jgi:hypothetical protein
MKNASILLLLLVSTSLIAAPVVPKSDEIGSITIIETTHFKNTPNNIVADAINDSKKDDSKKDDSKKDDSKKEEPKKEDGPKPIDLERTGKVIAIAKDMVALGQTIYDLVKKGRPTNTTSFAAISVVPKDPTTKEAISPFDLEGFSVPEERNFSAIVKNANDDVVVRFDYQLVYSFGGSYDGKGQYLTNVMIVPKSIQTSFGWDFSATMKLEGIMNHGSKANPIAGAIVSIKYQMNSWTKSFERNDTIHLTGAGQVKSFGIK